MEEKKERIKSWMAVCLIIVAFCIDIIEIVVEWFGGFIGVSSVIAVGSATLFGVWGEMLGIGFVNPKKLLISLATIIIEIIPGLDATIILSFGWTIGVIALVMITRAEDKGGLLDKVAGMAQGKISPQPNKPAPNFVRRENNVVRFQPRTSPEPSFKSVNYKQTNPKEQKAA
jgi:hypothetical protein